MKTFGKKENQIYQERKGAYLIVIQDDMLTCVQTPKGYFLLGGGMEENESKEACIKRECLEEIGYEVEIEKYVGAAQNYLLHPVHGYFHPIQYYYIGHLKEKITEPIEKDHTLTFLPLRDIDQKMYVPMQSWIINKILN